MFHKALMPLWVVLLCVSCDSGSSPVAPDLTVITLSANPTTIPPDGSATVQATVRTGAVPARTGTQIQFQTNLGQIDAIALTDGNGIARATLRAEGNVGTATVTASSGAVTASNTATVAFAASTLSANFTSTRSGLTVVFNNMSTGNPTSHAWDFGDGNRSSRRDPSHTYNVPGDYVVRLTIADAVSEDSFSSVIAVSDTPVADFAFSTERLLAVFTDRSSGEPTAWAWDFGDGGMSEQQSPSHTYGAAGTYRVVLTATNADGSDTRTRSVTVEALPVAGFTPMASGLSVIFTDTSSGPPSAWTWDFGDGNGSALQNPSHTYDEAGTYTVTLTVSNGEGSSSQSQFVTVAAP